LRPRGKPLLIDYVCAQAFIKENQDSVPVRVQPAYGYVIAALWPACRKLVDEGKLKKKQDPTAPTAAEDHEGLALLLKLISDVLHEKFSHVWLEVVSLVGVSITESCKVPECASELFSDAMQAKFYRKLRSSYLAQAPL